MNQSWLLGGLCALGVLVGCNGPDGDLAQGGQDEETLTLDASQAPLHAAGQRVLGLRLKGLEPLGAGFVYEGWLIVDGQPVSAGRFSLRSNDQTLFFLGPSSLLAKASTYVLTVEPAVGDDPAPSDVHVLAGDFVRDARGRLDTRLSVAHPAAFGQDFSTTAGQYILETPTSASTSDYALGIWFVDPAAMAPSLKLPTLPKGWVYEGWVVTAAGPVSTGRFTLAAGADSDGAGPTAGPLGAPPFPGQDFIQPPQRLAGAAVVLSVEPSADDSPAPFAIKPLVDSQVADEGAGVLQGMQNQSARNNPRGRALIF